MSDEEARQQILSIIDQLLARAKTAEAANKSKTQTLEEVMDELAALRARLKKAEAALAEWKKRSREVSSDLAYQMQRKNNLQAENKRQREALEAVQHLIDNSSGVCGLHLNGDEAPWIELLEGGRFETWLLPFSQAIAQGRGVGGE